jgi:hypothetical protein
VRWPSEEGTVGEIPVPHPHRVVDRQRDRGQPRPPGSKAGQIMVSIPLAAPQNALRTLKPGQITLPGRRLDVRPPVAARLGDQTVALQQLRPTVARDQASRRQTTVCRLRGVCSPERSAAGPPVLPVNPPLARVPNVASPVYQALLAARPTIDLLAILP